MSRYLEQKLPPIKATVIGDPTELGEIASEVPSRLCWDLVGSEQAPELHVRVQQPKKRGDGWTKGKRLNSSNVYSKFDIATPADRKVLGQLHGDAAYYARQLTFNVVEACHHLVGQSNVLLNGKPVEVVRFHPELEFYQTDQHCGVRRKQDPSGHPSGPILGSKNRLMEIRSSARQIRVASVPQGGAAALKTLTSLSLLPKSGAQGLIDRLKGYQHVLPIDLSAAGQKIETEQTRPALLLRSRKDGKLDYGFRVRGSQGNLYLPASGATLVEANSSEDKEPVTLKRDFNRETSQIDQLADHLNLPTDPLQGTVADFEQALELLETAQQLESDGSLEVMWDKQSVEPVRVLGTVTAKALRVEVGASRDWFQLKGKCELTNGSIDLSELLAGVANNENNGGFGPQDLGVCSCGCGCGTSTNFRRFSGRPSCWTKLRRSRTIAARPLRQQ